MQELKSLKEDPSFDSFIAAMRVLAKSSRDRAQKMGLFLRYYSKTDAGVVLLLVYVYLWTGPKKHYRELASLLTDAFEAAGRKKQFGADQLRMIWNSSGKGMLRFMISNLAEPREIEQKVPKPGLLGDIQS
jgi:hypothetical protein